MRRWKRYPAYRDSGVEWLGEVPEHWDVRRLRFNATFNPPRSQANGLDPAREVSFVPMEAVGEWGGLDLSTSKPIESIGAGYTWFQDGDVVVAKITPCFENGKGALATGLTNGGAFGTTELHVVRPRRDLDSKFLFYLTMSHQFRRLGEATMYGAGGQKRVPDTYIRDFRPGIPTAIDEQRAIAAFLDRETLRIDALIAKKQTLISLLGEQRAARVAHYVTRGTDSTVPLRDSGSPWMGKTPTHWDVCPIGRKLTLQRGVDITKSEQREGLIPVISSGGPSSFHDAAFARGPGVVLGRKGSVGTVHWVDGDYWPHDTTLYVKDFKGNNPRFVYYKLRALPLKEMDTGSANPTLNRNVVHPTIVSWPSRAEQDSIAAKLDHEEGVYESLQARQTATVTLLREQRQALISAAVTGQIDVRGEVPEVA